MDKDDRERFFEKSSLLANVNPDIVLKMLFLIITNAYIHFQARNLQWRSYTIGEVFATTRQVKLIKKKEFAVAALVPEYIAFIIYLATFNIDSGDKMHLLRRAKIAHGMTWVRELM